MHTKETPNHHVRGAINHLPLNIKRATECPVGKQGFWKYCFSSPSPHCNNLCFYFGRGWRRAGGLRNTVTNGIRFVPGTWLMPDCMHWSMPSQPSAHLLLLPKLIPRCPEKPYRQQHRDHLNVATFYPSKMQVYKNQKLEKWDSQLIWQQACLVLPACKRTSWEDCKDLSTSSFPVRYPKGSLQFSKPHAKIPLQLKKTFVFPNCDLPKSQPWKTLLWLQMLQIVSAALKFWAIRLG